MQNSMENHSRNFRSGFRLNARYAAVAFADMAEVMGLRAAAY
jgi:hypothetical protein